jgi:hypothetical protein
LDADVELIPIARGLVLCSRDGWEAGYPGFNDAIPVPSPTILDISRVFPSPTSTISTFS